MIFWTRRKNRFWPLVKIVPVLVHDNILPLSQSKCRSHFMRNQTFLTLTKYIYKKNINTYIISIIR
jgi:hypothetical protein